VDHVLLLIPTCTITGITAVGQTEKSIINLKVLNVTEVSLIEQVFAVLEINILSAPKASAVITRKLETKK
jgi:hypothetical protein